MNCPHRCELTVEERGPIECRYMLPSGVCSLVVLDIMGKRTLSQIGAHFNLTRERVRQIEAGAIRKLTRVVKLQGKQSRLDGLPTSGVSVAEQFEEVPL